jgi:hypothetical protein
VIGQPVGHELRADSACDYQNERHVTGRDDPCSYE